VSLITLLREGAAAEPDEPLIVSPERALSYAEALTRCEALARGLLARSIDRFACAITDAVELLPLLCASSAVGAEACVYPADADESLINDYLVMFDHRVIVSDRPLDHASAKVISVADLATDEGALPPPPAVSPTLILTTGTTGRARGVRHDWSRLVAAMRHSDDQPGARWLLAYNLNQFAGTQILLHVLASRATLVAPKSTHVRDAVAAVKELGVTHVSATPTFWRFFTGLIDPATARDMTLRQITLGGEAVPSALLDSLARLFPQARISQIYGATEFGMVGSVRDGRSGLPASVLDRGDDSDVQVRIIDGEIHLRSRVGMLGYYGEPDAGNEWRATGDLVRVEGDRIIFVGRASETINVGGVKVHPLPVEEAAGRVSGVALVRAYGRPSPVTGQIVALDVILRPDADPRKVEDEIRTACSALLPAAQPRRIRFVDHIETRGNKVARISTR